MTIRFGLPVSDLDGQLGFEPEPVPVPTFDSKEAQRLADEGMSNAMRAQRVTLWKEMANAWLASQPSGVEITADDLTRAVGLPDIGPARNNVVGAWFSGRAKAGKLVFAGRMRKSLRVERHGNVQRVWVVR
jgi:hypothetical protein